MMRYGFVATALLVLFILGRLTVPEPVPRIERVKEPVFITVPAPSPPPAPKRRATLEDVRKDWGIEGRLQCRVVQQ